MNSLSKKVVIAAEIFPPDIGGPATYAQRLAEVLASQSYEVVVVTYSDGKLNEVRGKKYEVELIRRQIPLPFRYWLYAWKLFKAAQGADVIYAQGPLSAGWPAMTVKKMTGAKLVVKIVGDQAWERARQLGATDVLLEAFQEETHVGKIGKIQEIQKEVLNAADDVITVSQWFKGVVARWGIDAHKINVIHNSVEIDVSSKSQDQNLDIEGDIILSVARLTKWKGMDTLIGLMPELLKENPDFKLVIAGSGPEEEDLKSKIKDLGLDNSVILPGRLSKEELVKYYQTAKMFVLNSGYENWSHVLIEAMHHGVPVVASREGGNPETVSNRETGLLVDYNNTEQIKNAIMELHNDADLRNTLSKRAREEVSSYSFDDMVSLTKCVLFD